MRTVSEVAKLTNVSVRTLHYYNEKEILLPSHVSASGYRYYSHEDIKRLRQIVIFKELGLSLKEIKNIMTDHQLDEQKVIDTQKQMLILKRNRLNYLIEQLDRIGEYDDLCIKEQEWELIWDEIYSTQGVVQSQVLDTVKAFADTLKEEGVNKVLDLGCGTGRNTIYLAQRGFNVTATDISAKGLDITSKKAKRLGYKLDTSRHDIRNIPFKDNTFDAILCSWVSGHGDHDDMVRHANEMLRVVKPGGLIFVDYPSKEDCLYGVGEEIAKDTFINNVPGEEKIPHHYSDEDEIRQIYKNRIQDLKPHTYKFVANESEHEIEAYLVLVRKQG